MSLLASCALHRLEPFGYMRDLLCLLPSWPVHRVLQLAPAYWRETLQNREAQQILSANIFRRFSMIHPFGREHLGTELHLAPAAVSDG